MDTVVVRSQRACVFPENFGGAALMGEIMRLLARNWMQQGTPERADELLRHAMLLEYGDRFFALKQAILRDWAILEVTRGNSEHAAELAILQTSLERAANEDGKRQAESLIFALKFEAKILHDVGLAAAAQAASREADALAGPGGEN